MEALRLKREKKKKNKFSEWQENKTERRVSFGIKWNETGHDIKLLEGQALKYSLIMKILGRKKNIFFIIFKVLFIHSF